MRVRLALGLHAGLLAGLLTASAAAQTVNCADIADDRDRLACYDRNAGRVVASPPSAVPAASAPSRAEVRNIRRERLGATLAERWELGDGQSLGTFLPRPYKPVYALPLLYSNRVNRAPTSPAPDHSVSEPLDVDATEFKYQISLKSKFVEGLYGGRGDLWLGYTQSSRWQIYNGPQSRPFRETNYEPELIVLWPTRYTLWGWHGRMLALAVNHQSNGRALPLSRSWNRVIVEAGFDQGDWSVGLRPWWRIKEEPGDDDNPGIENYIGRGELLLTRRWYDHVLTLQLRHSLRSGARSHGSAQLDWAFPVIANVKGYLQVFSGYGESLIDYNFRSHKIGLGASVVEWL